jgi:hypothetical protein
MVDKISKGRVRRKKERRNKEKKKSWDDKRARHM